MQVNPINTGINVVWIRIALLIWSVKQIGVKPSGCLFYRDRMTYIFVNKARKSLVQIHTKPLSEPVLAYCLLNSKGHISMKYRFQVSIQENVFEKVVIEMSAISAPLLWVKLSPLSAIYMRQCTGSSLVCVMACRLIGTKPLPEPILPTVKSLI